MYLDEATSIMRELDLPCWVAGGYMLSHFSNKPWRDIDIYFPSKRIKEKATQRLINNGYEIVDNWDDNAIKGAATVFQYKGTKQLIELIHSGNTPTETIQQFDFTICCCSFNNDRILEYHSDYFDHVDNRILVYTGATPFTNMLQRLKRLKKYVEKGFGIDQNNLKQWLSGAIEQHDSILAGKYSYTADFATIKEPLQNRLMY